MAADRSVWLQPDIEAAARRSSQVWVRGMSGLTVGSGLGDIKSWFLRVCVASERSLISIESSDSGGAAELSAREADALQATVACISACHIGDLFADSKFLQAGL